MQGQENMQEEVMTSEKILLMSPGMTFPRKIKEMTQKMKTLLEKKLAEEKANCLAYCKELGRAAENGEEIEEYQKVLETQYDTRLGIAQAAVNNAKVIYPEKQNKVVAIGSQITLESVSNPQEKITFILDGGSGKHGKIQIVDYVAPVGKQLLGKSVGAKVVVGQGEMIIKEIGYQW